MERGVVDVRYPRTEDGVNIAYTVEHNDPRTPLMSLANATHIELDDMRGRRALHEGRTVVRFDSRCQGLSDRNVSDLSLAARELDFLAVQRAVGLEKVAIVSVAQLTWPNVSYAAHHQESVRSLSLVGATVSGLDHWDRPATEALAHLAEADYESSTPNHGPGS